MSIHNIRYRESYDIKFRKIFIRLHIHGQTCKLIIVFPMILIKIAIYENQTTQLYFNCRTGSSSGTAIIKCSESFENFIILRKRTYILDALLSKIISSKLFFCQVLYGRGKKVKEEEKLQFLKIFSEVPHHTPCCFTGAKKLKNGIFSKMILFHFFLRVLKKFEETYDKKLMLLLMLRKT